MNKNCKHDFEQVAFNTDLDNGMELYDCVCKKCGEHAVIADTKLNTEEKDYIIELVNAELKEYLNSILEAQLKDIKQAWKDNIIFYLDDQYQADRDEKMIKSILNKINS